jgi:thioredoxin reductase (NADPH)
VAQAERGTIHAATTLLATGVVNRRPDMSGEMHDEALGRGLFRYCPICDAYELTDQSIAVIGEDSHAVNEAEFIRSYTADVTLVSPSATFSLDDFQLRRLDDIGVKALIGPCLGFELTANHIQITLPSGNYCYRAAYPALGSEVRSELAVNLGANVSTDNCLVVDKNQATNIQGLYAAGDVVLGLDQISSAIGQGGNAATAIRNQLSKQRSLLR